MVDVQRDQLKKLVSLTGGVTTIPSPRLFLIGFELMADIRTAMAEMLFHRGTAHNEARK